MVSETVPTEIISDMKETTITSESTESLAPMTTDRTSTISGSTSSPTQMTTDRTSTTSGSTSSPTQVTTDRTSTTSRVTSSPNQISTDRTSTTTSGTTVSPMPVNTDRTFTTTAVSPTQMSTDRTSTTTISQTIEETTTSLTVEEITSDVAFGAALRESLSIGKRLLRVDMMPTVIGVISWGVVPCGKKGAPTVYSNVTNYMDFINKYLLSNTIYLMCLLYIIHSIKTK